MTLRTLANMALSFSVVRLTRQGQLKLLFLVEIFYTKENSNSNYPQFGYFYKFMLFYCMAEAIVTSGEAQYYST